MRDNASKLSFRHTQENADCIPKIVEIFSRVILEYFNIENVHLLYNQNQRTRGAMRRRYQANGRNDMRLTSLTRILMAARAEIKAKKVPMAKKGRLSAERYSASEYREKAVAASMMGTAAIKEYSAATDLFAPRRRAPMMVEVEREKPGQRERH